MILKMRVFNFNNTNCWPGVYWRPSFSAKNYKCLWMLFFIIRPSIDSLVLFLLDSLIRHASTVSDQDVVSSIFIPNKTIIVKKCFYDTKEQVYIKKSTFWKICTECLFKMLIDLLFVGSNLAKRHYLWIVILICI